LERNWGRGRRGEEKEGEGNEVVEVKEWKWNGSRVDATDKTGLGVYCRM
jgi:hypothetical protein